MTAANTTSYPTRGNKIANSAPSPDATADFGTPGKLENVRWVNGKLDLIAVAIGSSTTVTLTAAQFVSDILDISGSPGGGVTLNTPTAAQIISALPQTIPQDGTFNFDVEILNDALAQTLTLTGGSNVTVVGTATIATNTLRRYLVNVNVLAGTVTMINLGSSSL